MEIVSIDKLPKNKVTAFFSEHWGSPQMVISSGIYQCDELDGFAAVDGDGSILGLITYTMDGHECEIVSLDSMVEKQGIGTALLQKVEQIARQKRCEHVKVITTNDNLHAMGFYQKRGYRLAALYVNAVEQARQRKPEIPLVADNGIPIRDEILFVKECS